MKDLSETHPSLNGLVAHIAGFENNDREDVYFVSDIQAHTIDKAVLRDKINQMIPSSLMCSGNPDLVMLRRHLNELKNGLGLEKEE